MTDEQHGYAPEPPAGDEGVPEYAAGDTGTRAVPVTPARSGADTGGARPRHYREVSQDEVENDVAIEAEAAPDESDQPNQPDDGDLPGDDLHGDDLHDDDLHDDSVVPMRSGGGRRAAPRRTRRGRSAAGCLAALVALVVVLGLVGIGGAKSYHFVKDHLGGSAADYPGPGTGSVLVQVQQGDTATDIGRSLKSAGVVESVDAFIDVARSNPDSDKIQVGYYQLKKKMKAAEALAVLVNPKSLIRSVVVVPEGERVDQIIDTITTKTSIKRNDVIAALKSPKLGLPAAAKGNPEGYLFPATYTVTPGETALQLLQQMVAKSAEVDSSLHLDSAAASVGLTPEQVVTVASILEYEAKRPEDYPKVARTIYNRLKAGMPLQSDATVSYASHVSGQVWTTSTMRASDSPYNTYKHTGLPPGPIGNPGETTLKAALAPASGSWLYWVVVNLKTGETVFSDTLAEHNAAVQKFLAYCKTSSAC